MEDIEPEELGGDPYDDIDDLDESDEHFSVPMVTY
jgi:hypothetical protein